VSSRAAVLGVLIVLAVAGLVHAVPPEEAIMPLEQYKNERARALAAAHGPRLRQIYDNVYHCLPWLDIHKEGLGFRKPRGAKGDDLYLSIWVWVEQIVTPEFSAMPWGQRASAMFSRYGVDLLRRLASDNKLATEPGLSGYAVVLSWLKPEKATEPGVKGVAETLAVFADKPTVHGFFGLTVTSADFARRAMVAAFDGKAEVGRVALEIWEDSFAKTFKLKDYAPDPSHRCG
jgi:hypothetical protein